MHKQCNMLSISIVTIYIKCWDKYSYPKWNTLLDKPLIIDDIKPYLHQKFMCEISSYELKHYVGILFTL